MEGRGITEFRSTGAAAGEGREVAVTLRKTPFHFVIRREWKLNYVGQPWPAPARATRNHQRSSQCSEGLQGPLFPDRLISLLDRRRSHHTLVRSKFTAMVNLMK